MTVGVRRITAEDWALARAIRLRALANAPAYAHPRFVWFIDELPLASTNKIDRNRLHSMAAERVADAATVRTSS